jgi:hypothetical protein
MSLKAYNKVWEHSKMSGSYLLVLLALADYADDDGLDAWGKNDRMAKKARLKTIRGLQMVYKALVDAGELVVEVGAGPHCHTKGGTQYLNKYHIIYQDGSNKADIEAIQERIAKGAKPSSPPAEGGEAAITPHPPKGMNHGSPPYNNKQDSKNKHSLGGDDAASAPSLPGMGGKPRRHRKRQPDGHPGGKTGRKSRIPDHLFTIMYRICFLADSPQLVGLLSRSQLGQVAGTLGALRDAGVDLERLPEFQTWWASNWRSKQRDTQQYQPPRPAQVQELWAEAMAARDAMRPPDRALQDVQSADVLHQAMLRRATNRVTTQAS